MQAELEFMLGERTNQFESFNIYITSSMVLVLFTSLHPKRKKKFNLYTAK